MNKKWIARTLLLLFSLFCVFFTKTPAIATSTQSSPFYWDRIDVNIDVQANGDMLITEEQEYVFNRAEQVAYRITVVESTEAEPFSK